MFFLSSWIPIVIQFDSITNCFRVNNHFETSSSNDPELALNTTRYKVKNTPYILDYYSSVPCEKSISLYGPLCFSYRSFWDKHLNNMRSNVTHICSTSTHKSRLSICFALQPTDFQLLPTLKQMHRMTSMWSWALQWKVTFICVSIVPESRISVGLALFASVPLV